MIYRHTEGGDSIRERQGRNKIKLKVKRMILISPCCSTFENAATRFKDAATCLSYKLFLQCPNNHGKRLEIKFQP